MAKWADGCSFFFFKRVIFGRYLARWKQLMKDTGMKTDARFLSSELFFRTIHNHAYTNLNIKRLCFIFYFTGCLRYERIKH